MIIFVKFFLIFILSLLLSAACSTPPRNPGETDDLRRRAESQLEFANRQAERGGLDAALSLATEAKRLAVAADDPDLRVRTGLSRGNILFSLGLVAEAEAEWRAALAESEWTGNSVLVAVSRIHIARGRLFSPAGGRAAAQSVREEITVNLSLLRANSHYAAFAWTVIGRAERYLGRYAEAEAAVRRSLDINMRNRLFELAAYDWFLIASFRSLSGNFDGARQALESAIELDRRVENSWGLANDWRALGDVESRAGNAEAARFAYTRSAEIFRAIGDNEAAAEALSRIRE